MNIKITYNWLLEYLDTKASPYDIQKYLSLCGPSIERVAEVGDDFVFDVEITSNRVDSASVMGVAQEAQTILPQFGISAKFKAKKYYAIEKSKETLPLEIKDDKHLTNRIVAVVMQVDKYEESPKFIKDRLEMCGIRSLNILVDITNYVMLETGQPTHIFDYDRIKSHKLVLRLAKNGEKIITLDKKEHTLNDSDIVIDDGNGVIVDLPGIMGTDNSVVTEDTKSVIFFTENNNPEAIRKTSMRLGIRTEAATINDKGQDPKLAKQALDLGVMLYQKYALAQIRSEVYDLYPNPKPKKVVEVYLSDIQRLMGVPIEEKKISVILNSLGFEVERLEDIELAYPDSVKYKITVPSSRLNDVAIKEDIVEEVARVYGYFKIPNNISPLVYIKQPVEIERLYKLQNETRMFFKNIGFNEFINYSMISEELIKNTNGRPELHLKLSNTISQEIEYMRTSLLPSLKKNIKDNVGKRDVLNFFEISKVYIPKLDKVELPEEKYKLAVISNTSFSKLKGCLELFLKSLHIENVSYVTGKSLFFDEVYFGEIQNSINKSPIGSIGKIQDSISEKMGIPYLIFGFEIDFSFLVENSRTVRPFKSIPKYAVVKLDLNIQIDKNLTFEIIKDQAKKSSKYLYEIEFIDLYNSTATVRFSFTSHEENITEEIAKGELAKIQSTLTK